MISGNGGEDRKRSSSSQGVSNNIIMIESQLASSSCVENSSSHHQEKMTGSTSVTMSHADAVEKQEVSKEESCSHDMTPHDDKMRRGSEDGSFSDVNNLNGGKFLREDDVSDVREEKNTSKESEGGSSSTTLLKDCDQPSDGKLPDDYDEDHSDSDMDDGEDKRGGEGRTGGHQIMLQLDTDDSSSKSDSI